MGILSVMWGDMKQSVRVIVKNVKETVVFLGIGSVKLFRWICSLNGKDDYISKAFVRFICFWFGCAFFCIGFTVTGGTVLLSFTLGSLLVAGLLFWVESALNRSR